MFTSPLDLRGHSPGRKIPEAGEWVVLQPLTWWNGPQRITVPRGFITDLASVPQAVQVLPGFGVNGKSRSAAVLHDYLYCSQLLTRAESDALFLLALRRSGVGLVTARMFWSGVRAGGWLYWKARRVRGLSRAYDFVRVRGLSRAYDFVPEGYFDEG